jgi:hypothetical protein
LRPAATGADIEAHAIRAGAQKKQRNRRRTQQAAFPQPFRSMICHC